MYPRHARRLAVVGRRHAQVFEETPYAPTRPGATSSSRYAKSAAKTVIERGAEILLQPRPRMMGRVAPGYPIVEQQDVDGFELQTFERARDLLFQKLGRDTVPDSVGILDHVGERPPGRLAPLSELQIRPLDVSHLADDDDLIARDPRSASTSPTSRSESPNM